MSTLTVNQIKTADILDSAGTQLVPKCITSEITVNVGSTRTYKKLSDAIAAYHAYYILGSGSLTFQLDAEIFSETVSINITNPTWDRVRIVGANPIDISLTSIASTSGSAGAWDQVLNVGSTTGVAIGQCVLIHTVTGGTNPQRTLGCHKITAIGNGTITIRNKNKHTTISSGAVTGTIRVLPTTINCTSTFMNVYSKLGGYGGAGINNIALSGVGGLGLHATMGGVIVAGIWENSVSGITLGVEGFYRNIHAGTGGRIYLTYETTSIVCSSGGDGAGISAHRDAAVIVHNAKLVVSGSALGVNANTLSTIMVGCDTAGQGIRMTGNTTNTYASGMSNIRRYNAMYDDYVTTSSSPLTNTYNTSANSFVEA